MGSMMGGGGVDTQVPVGQMNKLLDDALNNSLAYTQHYNNAAIGEQRNYYQQALQHLISGTQAAQINATGQANQAQAQLAPYSDAGYGALDSYMDSLMLARPEMGSKALSQALVKDAQAKQQMGNLAVGNAQLNALYDPKGNPFVSNDTTQDPMNLYGAPIKPTTGLLAQGVTPEEAQQYVLQNSMFQPNGSLVYMGQGADLRGTGNQGNTTVSTGKRGKNAPQPQQPWTVANPLQISSWYDPNGVYNSNTGVNMVNGGPNSAINNAMDEAIARQRMPYATSLYNQNLINYNQLAQLLGTYSPQQQDIAMAYQKGMFTDPTKKAMY